MPVAFERMPNELINDFIETCRSCIEEATLVRAVRFPKHVILPSLLYHPDSDYFNMAISLHIISINRLIIPLKGTKWSKKIFNRFMALLCTHISAYYKRVDSFLSKCPVGKVLRRYSTGKSVQRVVALRGHLTFRKLHHDFTPNVTRFITLHGDVTCPVMPPAY